ncbi:MAG: hypothetical protein ACPL07_00270, partial [Candidatus Bathyarchaeia archaeon]
ASVNILFTLLAVFPATVFCIGRFAEKHVLYKVDFSRRFFSVQTFSVREVHVPLDKIAGVELNIPFPLKFLNVGSVKVSAEGGVSLTTYFIDDPGRLFNLLGGRV